MSKRHQASRRRAYGRRQHEVRERAERPARETVDLRGISVQDVEGYDELLLDRLLRPETTAVGRSVLPGLD
jgi:hypothetical protein